MAQKPAFKTRPRPTAEEVLTAASSAVGKDTVSSRSAEAVKAAREANPSAPPATVKTRHKTVNLNVKVSPVTMKALSEAAQKEGLTQKAILMKALADGGLKIDEADLEIRRAVPWHER
ncbi:hypothetical protein [Gluconobacter sp. Dm-44]|uniref:hypothetical protein n=1 Tax=Gluconobacter sp. Dm-44 TaxID=2799805 RepID=UPI001B8BBCC2|nr:hypothetical protein [Gluconobacter sp. Dm-44]MBS1061167.1 hypothetical protein [Gluconobacter sp. Dm-44]